MKKGKIVEKGLERGWWAEAVFFSRSWCWGFSCLPGYDRMAMGVGRWERKGRRSVLYPVWNRPRGNVGKDLLCQT